MYLIMASPLHKLLTLHHWINMADDRCNFTSCCVSVISLEIINHLWDHPSYYLSSINHAARSWWLMKVRGITAVTSQNAINRFSDDNDKKKMFKEKRTTCISTWWCLDMKMVSALLALCEGNPLDSPHNGPVVWIFDIFCCKPKYAAE